MSRGFSLVEVVLATALLLLVIAQATQFAAQHTTWKRSYLSGQNNFDQTISAMQRTRANPAAPVSGVSVTTVATHLVELKDGELKTWVYQP